MAFALALGALAWTLAGRSDEPARPNLVLILADDFGYECVGANGGASYATPVLDRLAAEGARFEHCHALPLCTPSRVQLLTGMLGWRNYVAFRALAPGQTTFANLLRDAGYATCVVGKWQLGGGLDAPYDFGFDSYCLWQLTRHRIDGRDTRYGDPVLDVDGVELGPLRDQYGPDVIAEYAARFVRQNRRRPFLLFYSAILPHGPFGPTPSSPDWVSDHSSQMDVNGDPARYGEMVTYLDGVVGRIVSEIDALGLRERTLVVFTGDNGTAASVVSDFRGRRVAGGKGTTLDTGTHVPLIVRWPGTVPAGVVRDELVDFVDFLPTFLEVARVRPPPRLPLDGASLMPALLGTEGPRRKSIAGWCSPKGDPMDAKLWARDRRFKLYGEGVLHDVLADPGENDPIPARAATPEARSARRALAAVLRDQRKARSRALGSAELSPPRGPRR